MTYQDRTEQIKAGHLLDVIREKPALYLGEQSLSAIWHFLHGYHQALRVYGTQAAIQLPKDFDEWVAYRLHYFESTSGWRRMILDQVPDERVALGRFFELLDEHRERQPRVVAMIRGLIPETITLVAYTDDPGLFMTCEASTDFPHKDRLFYPSLSGVGRDMITVLNQDAFDRWLVEDRRAGRL